MKAKIEKHQIKKWEVSIIEIEENYKKIYKVTRRIPELNIAETKMLENKEEAIKLFQDWLN